MKKQKIPIMMVEKHEFTSGYLVRFFRKFLFFFLLEKRIWYFQKSEEAHEFIERYKKHLLTHTLSKNIYTMTSNYLFTYVFETEETTEEKELENFQDCLMHAANSWYLLQDERDQLSPDGGELQRVIITHARTGYVLATLPVGVLYAIYHGVVRDDNPVGIDSDNPEINIYSHHVIYMVMGGMDFKEQAIKVLGILADICLKQFNIPDDVFPCPPGYLSIKNAKRDLQYLTEFCKIAQYQLQGSENKSW